MGWYGMALIDVLDYLPVDHPGHDTLIAILNRWAPALERVQDPASGLWYQVLDQGSRAGNYLEASGSGMVVNVLAKGVRKGYLHKGWLEIARKGFAGLLNRLVKEDQQVLLNLEQICGACGLGGTPYRDGSYEYYVTENIVRNDYKGVGSFILAALEIEQAG
jgi:unsaturated rhamnogalacturonyl hydrolase